MVLNVLDKSPSSFGGMKHTHMSDRTIKGSPFIVSLHVDLQSSDEAIFPTLGVIVIKGISLILYFVIEKKNL